MDSSDPRILYAASYQRRRVPWGSTAAAPGAPSGRRPTTGKTWTKLTGKRTARSADHRTHRSRRLAVEAGDDLCADRGGRERRHRRGCDGCRAAAAAGRRRVRRRRVRPAATGRAPDPRSPVSGGRMTRQDVAADVEQQQPADVLQPDPRRPTNPEIVYTMGAPFFKSTDGGKTFRQVQGIAHSDHHALWIDPKNPNHLILATHGGLDTQLRPG